MTKESLFGIDCIFRETFQSEFQTRRNGGVPTDVSYSEGRGSFNGAGSYINSSLKLNNTYTIRFKVKPNNFTNESYLYDARSSDASGTGRIIVTQSTGVMVAFTGTAYVNGSAGSTLIAGIWNDIIISGENIITGSGNFPLVFGTYRAVNSNWFDGYMDLIEIYPGTLTAEEVSNLYNNLTYQDVRDGLVLDIDSRQGSIVDKFGNAITNTASIKKGSQFYIACDSENLEEVIVDKTNLTFNSGDSFSYGCWVRFKDVSISTVGALTKNTGASTGGWNIVKHSNNISTLLWDAGVDFAYNDSGVNPLQDKWYFAMCTYEAGTSKIYIDGKFKNEITQLISDSDANFYIGRFYSNTNIGSITKPIDASMARVYNRALSANEVMQLHTYSKGSFNG